MRGEEEEIKQLYEHIRRQTTDIAVEMTCVWLRRGNLKRET